MLNLPNIVKQRLEFASRAEAHPDPDLLTAYAEGTVTPRERLYVIDHMAACRDCRELLALSLPESDAFSRRVPATTSTRSTFYVPAFRWAILAACIVAVTVVSLRRSNQQIPALLAKNQAQNSFAKRDEKNVAPTVVGESSRAVEPMKPVPSAISGEAKISALRKAPSPARSRSEVQSFADRPIADKLQESSQSKEAIKASPLPRDEDEDTGKTGAVIAANLAPAMSADAGGGKAKPASPDKSERDGASAPTAAVAAKRSYAPAANIHIGPIITAAATVPEWTLTPDGVLQRSLDSGKSWKPIVVAHGIRFRAVTSSGSEIWVGGSAGSLYHSSDAGQQWQQVSHFQLPIDSDIIAIEFSDRLQGKIVTSDSEIWVTADGGYNWNRSH